MVIWVLTINRGTLLTLFDLGILAEGEIVMSDVELAKRIQELERINRRFKVPTG
jgi:hypothetical protein